MSSLTVYFYGHNTPNKFNVDIVLTNTIHFELYNIYWYDYINYRLSLEISMDSDQYQLKLERICLSNLHRQHLRQIGGSSGSGIGKTKMPNL